MFELTGKTALITGARRGMGRAHARLLARQGADVAVTDIDEAECQAVADEITAAGGSAAAWEMDVTDAHAVDTVITKIVEKFGSLDILVNNAGIYRPKEALELSEKEWEQTISVNLTGEFLVARRAAQEMKKNSYGRIINISSVASGQVGVGIAGGAHYTASKGGVIGMTETLAQEWAEHGITVNAIAPGAIETPMIEEAGMSKEETQGMLARIPLGRMGTPEEVSHAVIFLASQEASYVTGTTVYVDGGWLAV